MSNSPTTTWIDTTINGRRTVRVNLADAPIGSVAVTGPTIGFAREITAGGAWAIFDTEGMPLNEMEMTERAAAARLVEIHEGAEPAPMFSAR